MSGNNPIPESNLPQGDRAATNRPVEPGVNIVAEVTVSTATAIITHPDNPYLVLVGDSAKHPRPVIPGGKLEYVDDRADADSPGLSCVCREVLEEIGTELLNPRYIGKANDPSRDVRLVPVSKLEGAVVVPSLEEAGVPESPSENDRVKAHYGTPDYIYVGTVDPSAIAATEELQGNRFIDIRKLELGGLSAGHDVVILRYREMLEAGEDRLPKDALLDFKADAARFVG